MWSLSLSCLPLCCVHIGRCILSCGITDAVWTKSVHFTWLIPKQLVSTKNRNVECEKYFSHVVESWYYGFWAVGSYVASGVILLVGSLRRKISLFFFFKPNTRDPKKPAFLIANGCKVWNSEVLQICANAIFGFMYLYDLWNIVLPIMESTIACFRMLLQQTPTGAWRQSICMAHNSVCAEVMHMNVKWL